MTLRNRKCRIGIIGCGAIGSRIAKSIEKELKDDCCVSALFDIEESKSESLAKELALKRIVKPSLKDLIQSCDFVVEAVSAKEVKQSIIKPALVAKKSILVMSVGKLLNATSLFKLAKRNNCVILLPSGAISGLDAIKAAGIKYISKITLTTRKPPTSLVDSSYLRKKGIHLDKIKGEKVIFDGNVNEAVKHFPQNINVAATLALASHAKKKMRIRIITSPSFKNNSHEIEVIGDFGRMVSRTENTFLPDNPKTSYLAVLSAIQTLKQYFSVIKIGT